MAPEPQVALWSFHNGSLTENDKEILEALKIDLIKIIFLMQQFNFCNVMTLTVIVIFI